MAETLLRTKLILPPLRSNLVPRPRLIEQLNQGLQLGHKLTLISAPAGFGKTTLARVWAAQTEEPVAWLSVDESDNDPTRFLTYLVAALRRVDEKKTTFGHGALSMLQSPQPPPTKTVLSSLVNDSVTLPDRIILVLDDYHTIGSSSVEDALTFMLEYLPAQIHLVISTREDPRLPLSRLRAGGQLTEVRAADLRFASTEAAEFLDQVMGLALSQEDVKALETRTEGWIAGLQLAAISLQGKEDAFGLIESFSGSHRLVLDYLVEEVLEQQPERIRNFLLQTAILSRLTGSLCDALTGQESGQSTLEALEHANLFIVPLDEERRWYRYHHLFADLLRQRLNQSQPERVTDLHSVASEWYERTGLVDEAIEHALSAANLERALDLIEQHVDTVLADGEYANLRHWLEELPNELVLSRPQLCIFRAWELFASGRLDEGKTFLQAAELAHDSSVDQPSRTETQTGDQLSGSGRLPVQGRADAIQAWMTAYQRHNISGLIQHLRQALESQSDQDLRWRSAVAITLADVYAFSGDMMGAYWARLEALKICEATGNSYLYLYNSAKLAINLRAQGQLHQVQELCQGRVQFAGEIGISHTAVVGWLLAIWGEALAETDDLGRALELSERGIELTETGGDKAMFGWSCLCLMRILFSKGDMDGAEEVAYRIEKAARESVVPTWIVQMNAAWRSRFWLAQNRLEAASQWVRERGLGLDAEPTHMDRFEYVSLARILIAQGRLEASDTLLQRMLETEEGTGNTTRVIEIGMLQALTRQASGDTGRAMVALERALSLAEPGGFIRIFADEGPAMARLLFEALDRGIAPDYVRRLLAAFPSDVPVVVNPSISTVSQYDYVEPLSEREVEILQLIAEGLTNAGIANKLFLSLHTVKTHARNIYSKLGVHNRTEAVARARALGILPST
jgi:LuxR family maltose regulon positive regulatory protein